jgi:hypothetical protein
MTIEENLKIYGGKPVADFALDDGEFDFDEKTPRLRLSYDDYEKGKSLAQSIAAFVRLPGAPRTQALVIGSWGYEDMDSATVVESLVAYRDRLPELRALFVGDITREENEISWINQSDLSALWPSFPKLEQIGVRGASNLTLGRLSSEALKSLTIEAGGLPQRTVREALAINAPNLEHLEIWIGSANYGADSTPADFSELLAGRLFPRLRTLGLRDCEYADELARAVAEAPVLERIETLDLSLGNLSDEGAEALLASPLVRRLKKLDLHHHYLSDAMMQRMKSLEVEVDLSDQEAEDDYDDEVFRYIAVSE